MNSFLLSKERILLFGLLGEGVDSKLLAKTEQVIEYQIRISKQYEVIGFSKSGINWDNDRNLIWCDSYIVQAYEQAYRLKADYFLIGYLKDVNDFYHIQIKLYRLSDIQPEKNISLPTAKNEETLFYDVKSIINRFHGRSTEPPLLLFAYRFLPYYAKIYNKVFKGNRVTKNRINISQSFSKLRNQSKTDNIVNNGTGNLERVYKFNNPQNNYLDSIIFTITAKDLNYEHDFKCPEPSDNLLSLYKFIQNLDFSEYTNLLSQPIMLTALVNSLGVVTTCYFRSSVEYPDEWTNAINNEINQTFFTSGKLKNKDVGMWINIQIDLHKTPTNKLID